MTQQEVDAYNARRQRTVTGFIGAGQSYDTCENESELHGQILDECARRGWIALHGSMAHRAMRTPGEFDFVVLASGGLTFFIEAKTRTGKLTVEQAALKHWAENLGHKPVVVRSISDFLSHIEQSTGEKND